MRLADCVNDEQVPSATSSYFAGIGAVAHRRGGFLVYTMVLQRLQKDDLRRRVKTTSLKSLQ